MEENEVAGARHEEGDRVEGDCGIVVMDMVVSPTSGMVSGVIISWC